MVKKVGRATDSEVAERSKGAARTWGMNGHRLFDPSVLGSNSTLPILVFSVKRPSENLDV